MVETADPSERSPDTVALMVADDEDRLLVFWHTKYRFWTVPLGKVEIGEGDIHAAKREAYEELGIISQNIELFDKIHKPANLDDYSDIMIALCRVTNYTGKVANLEPDKHGSLQFLNPSDIFNLHPLSYPTKVIAARLTETLFD
ncbi:NUDIX hydrolase [Sphingobium sp. BHU LFT2]|uniref:NUDIX hydrolase n=1 Tax=Sphingobium sp. BHU LFT2 TaxID=2807634 RepID=UPI001BEC8781|nr:NUDIX hydrolase [Sphingobium sp. BHU LFT2]MBT2244303.1 NUDIX hydrolase [Sphingobium sp. BHU LFT2]